MAKKSALEQRMEMWLQNEQLGRELTSANAEIARLQAEREKLAKLVVMLRDHPLPDSLRDAFESAGAEEELRRLAADWEKRGRERRMLAQELVDRADEIKARREVADEA